MTVMSPEHSSHDWLPGPLGEGPLPLSADELKQLYASNVALTDEDVSDLSQSLPYVGDVLTPTQFNRFAMRRKNLGRFDAGGETRDTEGSGEQTVAAVADLCGTSSAKVVQALRSAVVALSPDEYEVAYGRLITVSQKREAFQTRKTLLTKLARVAPTWANAIATRQGIHASGTLPGDADAAWRWRQAHEAKA